MARRLWKTFYLQSARDYLEIGSVWQAWPRSNPRHEMIFEGRGIIQTNLPLYTLKMVFRVAGARWVDYVSHETREV